MKVTTKVAAGALILIALLFLLLMRNLVSLLRLLTMAMLQHLLVQ